MKFEVEIKSVEEKKSSVGMSFLSVIGWFVFFVFAAAFIAMVFNEQVLKH